MPIYLNILDLDGKLERQSSALIVPCYMCPAVTIAVRDKKPFLQLYNHLFKSPPFDQYLKSLQCCLKDNGVSSVVFKSNFIHQWFLCLWTSGRRKKLMRQLHAYDYLIVIGCDSATETVRDLIKTDDCKVIQGMVVMGFMNAKMRFHLPCNISFEDCNVIPFTQQKTDHDN